MVMNKLISISKPVKSIVIYDNRTIEVRDIKTDGSIGPAKHLYQKTINKIFQHLKGEFMEWTFKNIIDKKFLYVNNKTETIIWKEKACVKNLLFKKKELNGSYALPSLVFKLKNNTLSVVAVKTHKMNSKCFSAPFPNTYSGNTICMGNAQIDATKLKYYEDIVDEALNKFYYSMFTGNTEEIIKYKNLPVYPLDKLENSKSFKRLKDFIND